MDLPELSGAHSDLPANASDLPNVEIGSGLDDPFDEERYDFAAGGASDPLADIDTSVVGVGNVGGYDDARDHPPLQVDKLPVYDRHRSTANDDTEDLSELLGSPAALADRDAPETAGPGDVGPPLPPPPGGRGGENFGDDDEGDGDDEARRIMDDITKIDRAFDAVAAGPPPPAGEFSWLQPERAVAPDDAPDDSAAAEPIRVDEVDRILYGEVEIRGKVFGQDVDSPDFEPPQAEPAPAAIFEEVERDSHDAAAAGRVVERAREAGLTDEMQIGTGAMRPAVPAEDTTEAAVAEMTPAALAEVPTADQLAPDLAREVTEGGTPASEEPIDPEALRQAARLRRFGLASAAGRAAADAVRNGDRDDPRRVEAAGHAEPAAPEPAGEAGRRVVELNVVFPGEAPPPTAGGVPPAQAGLPARLEGTNLAPQLQDAPTALPASAKEYAQSLDEQMLERVLGGLRGATGQADRGARAEVEGVEVTAEEVAAAGGDPYVAAAEKMRRQEAAGERPAAPSEPARDQERGDKTGDDDAQ